MAKGGVTVGALNGMAPLGKSGSELCEQWSSANKTAMLLCRCLSSMHW